MALAQSIGGPINNNVVTLLEKTDHYESRQDHHPFKPTGLPKLAAPAQGIIAGNVEHQRVKARFHCATTRFNKDGEPLNSIVLLRAVIGRKRYEFLIGTGPGSTSAFSICALSRKSAWANGAISSRSMRYQSNVCTAKPWKAL